MIKVLSVENNIITAEIEKGKDPVVGKHYDLVLYNEVTYMQHKLFHPLCIEWFNTGMHSYNVKSWFDLRQSTKLELGEGNDYYTYSDDNHNIKEAKTISDIPDSVVKDFIAGNENRIKPHLKSLTKYTKKQFTKLIDSTIKSMIASGVNSKKFNEIMEGINYEF